VASLVYTSLVSGSGTHNPLLMASPAAVFAAITGNPQAIVEFVNEDVTAAEAGLPEGERVQLAIRGWTIPLLGSVGAQVAGYINQQWRLGNIRDLVTGEVPQAWPEYPSEVAQYVGSSDTLYLRWRKGQPFVVWFVGFLILGLGVLYLLSKIAPGWFGGGTYTYTMSRADVASTAVQATPPPGMPLWEKILLIGGGVIVAGGLLWFLAELKLREAGANKSYQEIIIER